MPTRDGEPRKQSRLIRDSVVYNRYVVYSVLFILELKRFIPEKKGFFYLSPVMTSFVHLSKTVSKFVVLSVQRPEVNRI